MSATAIMPSPYQAPTPIAELPASPVFPRTRVLSEFADAPALVERCRQIAFDHAFFLDRWVTASVPVLQWAETKASAIIKQRPLTQNGDGATKEFLSIADDMISFYAHCRAHGVANVGNPDPFVLGISCETIEEGHVFVLDIDLLRNGEFYVTSTKTPFIFHPRTALRALGFRRPGEEPVLEVEATEVNSIYCYFLYHFGYI
jgi:hypothetical protein